MRLVASLGHYVATRDAPGFQIHQYAPARIATELPAGSAVALRMETRYPWEGSVRLTIEDGRQSVDARPARARMVPATPPCG